MEPQNLSRRQQYTINALQEAYIDLKNENPDTAISVSQLCRQADVNRTTFYRYFLDVEDLTDYMINNTFNEIFSVLQFDPQKGSSSARKHILQALSFTLKNRKLFRYLLIDSHSDIAEKALESHLLLIRDTIQSTGCPESEAVLSYSLFFGGMARLWVSWINSNFEAPKERVALYIEQFILYFYQMMESGFMV